MLSRWSGRTLFGRNQDQSDHGGGNRKTATNEHHATKPEDESSGNIRPHCCRCGNVQTDRNSQVANVDTVGLNITHNSEWKPEAANRSLEVAAKRWHHHVA